MGANGTDDGSPSFTLNAVCLTPLTKQCRYNERHNSFPSREPSILTAPADIRQGSWTIPGLHFSYAPPADFPQPSDAVLHSRPPSWDDAAARILALQETLVAALHDGDRKAQLEACLARQLDLLVGTSTRDWYNHNPAVQAPYARLFAHLVVRARSINKRDGPVCAILFLVSNAPSYLDTISCQLID